MKVGAAFCSGDAALCSGCEQKKRESLARNSRHELGWQEFLEVRKKIPAVPTRLRRRKRGVVHHVLLINFSTEWLKDGISRVVNGEATYDQ